MTSSLPFVNEICRRFALTKREAHQETADKLI
jgi:hypothetical protein